MQQQLVQAESRREQLEAENQNLRLRGETAAGEKDGEMEDGVGKINTHKMYLNSANGLVIFRFPIIVEQTANTQIYKPSRAQR